MNKKRIFGIILFIVLGLVMFTFANPKEENNQKLEGNNQTEQQPTDEQPTPDTNNEIEEEDSTNIVPTTTEPTNRPTNNLNNTNNNQNTPVEDSEIENEVETPGDNEEENLDEYKETKKTEIKDYLSSLNLEDQTAIETLIDESNQQIDDATTKEEIDKVVEETKKAADELKIKEEQEKAQRELETLKEEKIQEIKDYKNDYIYNDENQEKYNDLIDNIIENIKNSENEEKVIESLDNGKQLIDALIEEDLEAYKELKIKEIIEYKESINWNESYEVLASIIVDNAKNLINQSITKEEIDKIVNEVIETLDNLKNNQILDEYKETKKQEISEYNKDELYSEENKKLVNEIKEKTQEEISNANDAESVDRIVTAAKEQIDEIQKLTETKFTVTFTDFHNNIIKTEEVLYGESATAPTVKDITNKSIVYSFEKWDEDFTEIKTELTVKAIYKVEKVYANIYALNEGLQQPTDGIKYNAKDYTKIGNIELKITEVVLNAIKQNKTTIITTEEETIKNMVVGKLPQLDKQNYKYNYYVLKFEKSDGFHIDASQIIDEEELAKNTVTITYKLDESLAGCTMENNQTTMTSTVTTGRNEITELPKVYKNGKEYAVVWKDSNDSIISNITEKTINLIENPTVYTKSTTVTATIDKQAPTLTLIGDKEFEVELSLNDEYEELGYIAIDNFEGNITTNVKTKISYNGIDTNEVNYSVSGVYVITYSVEDKEGNKTTTTRTITVIDPIKVVKAQVYLLNENVSRPENDFDKNNYTKIGEVDLKVNRVRKYIDGTSQIITTKNNIHSYVQGGSKALPKTNEKYYYYEYYLFRYYDGNFYIEAEKIFDSETYNKDKKAELKELLNRDYSEYETTKTNESYNNLINTINDNKNKELKDIEEIEKAIEEIKTAISNLEDIKLIRLTLSRNNDTYILNDSMNMDLIVTAVYNDPTRTKVLTDKEYQMSNDFNSTTVGKKSITYTYENKSVTYNYTINYTNKELNQRVEEVKISLVREVIHNEGEHWYEDTYEDKYMIKFENLNGLKVTNIQVKHDGNVVRNISLNKDAENVFVITKEEYETLKTNNTLIYGNTIKIDYTINNQDISGNYYELMNELYIVK